MQKQLLPDTLRIALKEWAVAVRALREGRQIILLRKGGIIEAEGEFTVDSRNVLLFPTYEHQEEQPRALQPCYSAWVQEEQERRPGGEMVRINAAARISDIMVVTDFDALMRIGSQHIYSDEFVRGRIEYEPSRPLYCLFLRAYNLADPVTIPMDMDYYGCKSWIELTDSISTSGSEPAMGDEAYERRVEVLKDLLTR